MRPPSGKRVLLLLRCAPQDPRAAQALRSAVGYLTADLQVTLVCCGPAAALGRSYQADPARLSAALRRPLDTLRAFGQPVYVYEEGGGDGGADREAGDAAVLDADSLSALARGAHAVISW